MMSCYIAERIDRFVNVAQDDSTVTFEMLAPVLKPDQLEIWVEHDCLVVKVTGPEKMLWDNIYMARTLRIALPKDSWRQIQPDSTQTAFLHEGVLVVTFHKSKKKVIPVQWIASSES